MIRRVFLMVMDSFGIGHAKDAAAFGDEGANTLASVASTADFSAPNLARLGLFHIDGTPDMSGEKEPVGAYARLGEQSNGKDSTIGHWEIAGIRSDEALPTFPEGFPEDFLREFEKRTGRGILCNKPYSGTDVIRDYGREHEETGKLIVYTSVDSVLQIAAHEDVVTVPELYSCCEVAREMLTGNMCVGRVIARPFVGGWPYMRTAHRRDFSAVPPKTTFLDLLSGAGLDTIAVGKILDLYAGVGITDSYRSKSNEDGMRISSMLQARDFHGLCFVNYVDFDTAYGHRRDTEAYAKSVMKFDAWLGTFMDNMRDEDVLMITADHGCDPNFRGTDHTRENVPLLVYGKEIKAGSIGYRESFSDIAATVCEMFGVPYDLNGESMLSKLK